MADNYVPRFSFTRESNDLAWLPFLSVGGDSKQPQSSISVYKQNNFMQLYAQP
jgi:hypothetical protein